MTEEYIKGLFDRNASEFKVDKKDGVFIPIDVRMDLQDFRKAAKEIVKNLTIPDVIESAFNAGRERLNHPDWDFIYEDFEEYKEKHLL